MTWEPNTKNDHGVYCPCERLTLRRKSGMTALPLAEIRLAETPDGWRGATSFNLSTGSLLGSSRPITDHSAPHGNRNEAVKSCTDYLIGQLSNLSDADGGREAREIIAWANSLCPAQLDLFGDAA